MPVISMFYGIVVQMFVLDTDLRLVQAWIEIHREELDADWTLAAAGNQPYKIEPLR